MLGSEDRPRTWRQGRHCVNRSCRSFMLVTTERWVSGMVVASFTPALCGEHGAQSQKPTASDLVRAMGFPCCAGRGP